MSIAKFKHAQIFWKNISVRKKIEKSFEVDPIKVFDGELTAREVFDGFIKWRGTKYIYRGADEYALALMDLWGECSIRMARNAMFLTAESIAKKMGISKAAFSKLERAERKGTISIKTLAAVAEAMDCHLVYAIKPKNQKLFSEIVWEKLLPEARIILWRRICNPLNKSGGLAGIADELTKNPKFRRKQGWSRNE